jgi:hypothetical protein
MDNEEFYRRCAELLGTRYDCTGLTDAYRTRWNNRRPGHGRFPGFGIIRLHGDDVHVSLRHPVSISRHFTSRAEALGWLTEAVRAAA